MAAHGARRLGDMTTNLARILGIELLVAAQGVDLRKRGIGFEGLKGAKPTGLVTSPALERVLALLRSVVPMLEDDRYMAPDIAAAADLVASGALLAAAGLPSGPVEIGG
jgi:histidine ammonia-lyase